MRVYICCLTVLLCVAVSTLAAREWTSRDGNFTIEAELIDFDQKNVRLKNENGTVLTVPLDRLSLQDRQFIATRPKSSSADTTGKAARARLEEQKARSALEKAGIRVVSSGLVLAEEAELSRGLRDITKVRRSMFNANRELLLAQSDESKQQAAISHLMKLNIQLNAQLAQVGPNDVLRNNNLVGAINGNNSKIGLLQEQLKAVEERVGEKRGKAIEAREAYIQKIVDLREVADRISERLREVATDQEIVSAVEQFNQASGKAYQLGQSRSFKSSLNRLKRVEETVLSETIVLRHEFGVSHVSVVVNGKHTQEMVVDSGAGLVSLPGEIARKCGISVKDTDPTIILELADGRQIEGKLVLIDSVRVGKFTRKNVECAVLGPDAPKAVPLLGMSFLGHFKFELNAQQSSLTLVQVDDS